jgi:glycosyltransferase involved in cell wall biosynthesis
MMADQMRLAFVHDWLTVPGGSERALEVMLGLYPQAALYAPVFDRRNFEDSPIAERGVQTSFIDRLPLSKTHHRWFMPLMPLAVEQFDLRGYDVVISGSHAVAHGVLTRPDQLHVNYVYSPMRYAWHMYHAGLTDARIGKGLKTWLARPLLHYLRLWDLAAAGRVDTFIASSQWIARAIWRAYRRESTVIYPPVRTHLFAPAAKREDFYVTVSRLVPYKRVDLIVKAFGKLGYPLVVVGDGPEYPTLKKQAESNVQILKGQTDEQVANLLGRAKAFVYAAEEDFGLAPVEAQAAGCPVIAYRKGGLVETVVEWQTGIFYNQQSAEALMAAVEFFESGGRKFDERKIVRNAQRFAVERFEKEFSKLVERQWRQFRLNDTTDN